MLDEPRGPRRLKTEAALQSVDRPGFGATDDRIDDLRQGGAVTGGPAAMTPKDRSRFLSKLDEAVNAVRCAHPKGE